MQTPGTEAGAQNPAQQRRIAAQNRLEWEQRVRSPDPTERGAGWCPIVEPADEPMPDFAMILLSHNLRALTGACVVKSGPVRVVRVIENPMAEVGRIKATPMPADGRERVGPQPREGIWGNRFAYAGRQNAKRSYLTWAAFFGATVVELQDRIGQLWVFDVILADAPGGSASVFSAGCLGCIQTR
jgi:hypothetical protein